MYVHLRRLLHHAYKHDVDWFFNTFGAWKRGVYFMCLPFLLLVFLVLTEYCHADLRDLIWTIRVFVRQKRFS